MILIKAMTGSIVSPGRALVGSASHPSEFSATGAQFVMNAIGLTPREPKCKFYYRGGSVPFEMVRAQYFKCKSKHN
jgi:hypothetical protein